MRNKKKFNEFMNKTIDELKDERLFTFTSSTEPI